MDKFLKILCSIPVILLALFYSPFLGICLILFRYYIYKNTKYYFLPICLIISGIVIIIPNIIDNVLKTFKIAFNPKFISDFVSSDLYEKLFSYSKLLLILGILILFLSFMFRNLINKFSAKLKSSLKDYIKKYENEKREIREKNDLIVKERREIVNNTHLVHCNNCGADNTIVGKTGKCKYCRSDISFKE